MQSGSQTGILIEKQRKNISINFSGRISAWEKLDGFCHTMLNFANFYTSIMLKYTKLDEYLNKSPQSV